MKSSHFVALITCLILGGASAGNEAPAWQEGKNYFLVLPPQPTSVPRGKVEVTEVFSYACPVCNRFQPYMRKLKSSLPANAVIDYLPASFIPTEDWPMFQRAYLTAQALGVADRAHEAMYDAIWKTGELAVMDPATGNLKDHPPTIEDAARFYHRVTGVPEANFIATAGSMGVDTAVIHADLMVEKYGVTGTPTIIVGGKYRLDVGSAGDPDKLIELVKWLVAKQTR